MDEITMPIIGKCDRTNDCPEVLDHLERCPKFDAEFWSKVVVRSNADDGPDFPRYYS